MTGMAQLFILEEARKRRPGIGNAPVMSAPRDPLQVPGSVEGANSIFCIRSDCAAGDLDDIVLVALHPSSMGERASMRTAASSFACFRAGKSALTELRDCSVSLRVPFDKRTGRVPNTVAIG